MQRVGAIGTLVLALALGQTIPTIADAQSTFLKVIEKWSRFSVQLYAVG
jgi:hypothetical protein